MQLQYCSITGNTESVFQLRIPTSLLKFLIFTPMFSFFFSKLFDVFVILFHFISLFLFLWSCWVVVAMHGLSLVSKTGATLHAAHGFSLWWLLLLLSTGSALGARASIAEAQELSCSAACGNFPRSGIEPVSPALASGFLSTVSPGKSYNSILKAVSFNSNIWVSYSSGSGHSFLLLMVRVPACPIYCVFFFFFFLHLKLYGVY